MGTLILKRRFVATENIELQSMGVSQTILRMVKNINVQKNDLKEITLLGVLYKKRSKASMNSCGCSACNQCPAFGIRSN